MSIRNSEAHYPTLSARPPPCSSQYGHKVAVKASLGPELGLAPPQSRYPLLHPDLHSSILLPGQKANPKGLRKGRAC